MFYREFGKTGKKLSAVGMGTNRFAVADLKDEAGLHRAADIIYTAAQHGVNYIDCGHTYSQGRAEEIVKLALQKIKQSNLECFTSTKVMYAEDATEPAARKRIEKSFSAMGIDKATFGFCWKVSSYDEFLNIIKKGGVYTALEKAKAEGLIEHIVISSHASPEETIKILSSGLFEGCMISCNILNMRNYRELFDYAQNHNLGILTMNSLGGGVIAKQHELSGQIMKADNGLTLVQNALCSLYANEAITCMLSCMENVEQLEEDIAPFEREKLVDVINYNTLETGELANYCTKCRYCRECPMGIPIADMMYAYSNKSFHEMMKGYGDDKLQYADDEMNDTARIFNPRFCDYSAIPKTDVNPCVKCGKCERICTQKLPIISRVDEMYERAAKVHFSHEQRKKRLHERLNTKGYQKVGFFPAGKYTAYLLEAYLQYFGSFPFEVYVFDNNEEVWGTSISDVAKIYSPKQISKLGIDYILVSNYRFGENIYQDLICNQDIIDNNILVEKLHEDGDIAWY